MKNMSSSLFNLVLLVNEIFQYKTKSVGMEHRNLTDYELDRLVKQTFRIDQATLREVDGVGDLITVNDSKEDGY
jgi:hypothetical protein